MKKILNPKWLYAAVVFNTNGERIGTVCSQQGDTISYLSKGKIARANAYELDNLGLLAKKSATDKKYI
jgi:hypothetical protein